MIYQEKNWEKKKKKKIELTYSAIYIIVCQFYNSITLIYFIRATKTLEKSFAVSNQWIIYLRQKLRFNYLEAYLVIVQKFQKFLISIDNEFQNFV